MQRVVGQGRYELVADVTATQACWAPHLVASQLGARARLFTVSERKATYPQPALLLKNEKKF